MPTDSVPTVDDILRRAIAEVNSPPSTRLALAPREALVSDGPAGEARGDAVAAIALLFAKRRTAGAVSMSGSHNPTPAEVKVAEEAFDIATRAARAGAAKGDARHLELDAVARAAVRHTAGVLDGRGYEAKAIQQEDAIVAEVLRRFAALAPPAASTPSALREAFNFVRVNLPECGGSCAPMGSCITEKCLRCYADAALGAIKGESNENLSRLGNPSPSHAGDEVRTEPRSGELKPLHGTGGDSTPARAAQPTPPAPRELRWLLKDVREYLMTGDTNVTRKSGLVERLDSALAYIAAPTPPARDEATLREAAKNLLMIEEQLDACQCDDGHNETLWEMWREAMKALQAALAPPDGAKHARCPTCGGGARDHRETHPICQDGWHDARADARGEGA